MSPAIDGDDHSDRTDEYFKRVRSVSDFQESTGFYGRNGDGPNRNAVESERNPQAPPQHVTRHPEDPANALLNAASEYCDPEAILALAVNVGKTLYALQPEVVEEALSRQYGRIHDIRAGAAAQEAQAAVGDQILISSTTTQAVAEILTEAVALQRNADRLEGEELPKQEELIEEIRVLLDSAEAENERRRDAYDRERISHHEQLTKTSRNPEKPRKAVTGRTKPDGNLFARVRLPGLQAKVAMPLEVLIFTAILMFPLADVTGRSLLEAAFMATGISVTVLAASSMAGFAAAAIRLPGSVAGLIIVALYAALLATKFVGPLDELRLANNEGILILSSATLFACLIGAVTGFAVGTWRDHHPDRTAYGSYEADGAESAASPVQVAKERYEESQATVEGHGADLKREREKRDDLQHRIRGERKQADELTVKAVGRMREGTEARVREATLTAIAHTTIGQERAAAELAVEVAMLMHLKTRAEKLTEDEADEDSQPNVRGEEAAGREPPMRLRLAIGCLAVGGLGALVAGPIAPAIGSGAAATILLVAHLSNRRTTRPNAEPSATPGRSPAIGAQPSMGNEEYRRLPDHLVPKYRDGGAGVSEQH